MAADLGFVAHAAERCAHELAVQSARDRASQAGFTHAWRADQTQNRRAHLGTGQLAHGQILKQPLLDLLQPVVVFVEHLARFGQRDRTLLLARPRQRQQPIDIRADHAGLGRVHALLHQPLELVRGGFFDVVGRLKLADLALELVDRVFVEIVLAQLATDRLHLLAQEVFLLRLVQRVFGIALDLGAQPQQLELPRQLDLDLFKALNRVQRVQEIELVLELKGRAVNHDVGQVAGLGDALHKGDRLLRHLGHEADDFLDLRLDLDHQRFGARAILLRVRVRDAAHHVKRIVLHQLADQRPRLTLQDNAHAVVGQLEEFLHLGDHADRRKLLRIPALICF